VGEGEDAAVVPWTPGPVRRGDGPRDVDVVLDELFGPADEGGPGWFDAVLLVAGAVLLARGAIVWGVVLVVLGLALPARSLARRVQRRARRRRYEALLASGSPLASSPATAELLAAYDGLLAAAAPHGSTGEEAVGAGHRAVVECASMLGGRAPSTPEETAYVARRASAIRAAAAALRAAPPDRDERVAAVRAREEIDALNGATSIDDLDVVVRSLSR
jgi:hypothetical protein